MKKLKILIVLTLFCFGHIMAETVSDTIFIKGFGNKTGKSYITEVVEGQSYLGTAINAQQFIPDYGQIKGNQTTFNQFQLWNTEPFSGLITEITVIADTNETNYFKNNLYVAVGVESQAKVNDVTNLIAWDEHFTWYFDSKDQYTYFKLLSNEKFTSGSVKNTKIIITYNKLTTSNLNNIKSDQTVIKKLINNQLVIIKNNKCYNAFGTLL